MRPRGSPGEGRPSCEPPRPTPHHPLVVRPDAVRRPRHPRTTGYVDPPRPTGRPATPSHSRSSAAQTAVAGAAEPDTWTPDGWTPDGWTPDAWTLDAWTLEVRSTGWTDVLTAGPDEADRATTGLAAVRTSSRPAITRRAARPRPGHGAWGALGHPERLRGDGTAPCGSLPPHSRIPAPGPVRLGRWPAWPSTTRRSAASYVTRGSVRRADPSKRPVARPPPDIAIIGADAMLPSTCAPAGWPPPAVSDQRHRLLRLRNGARSCPSLRPHPARACRR
jgi:hypothetical protein